MECIRKTEMTRPLIASQAWFTMNSIWINNKWTTLCTKTRPRTKRLTTLHAKILARVRRNWTCKKLCRNLTISETSKAYAKRGGSRHCRQLRSSRTDSGCSIKIRMSWMLAIMDFKGLGCIPKSLLSIIWRQRRQGSEQVISITGSRSISLNMQKMSQLEWQFCLNCQVWFCRRFSSLIQIYRCKTMYRTCFDSAILQFRISLRTRSKSAWLSIMRISWIWSESQEIWHWFWKSIQF